MSQQLCLEISPTNFSGAVIDRKTRVELQQFDTKLEGRTTEDKKDQIKELLHRQGLLSFSDEVSLAIQSAKSTLVPQNIFSESKAEDIYRLCFGAATDSVDYNRFHEQGLVNVYAQEDWVKSFFVIRFPKIIIQHENTHVLRGIFHGSTFKPQLHLVPSSEHFSLLVSAKNKLEFYNVFDSRTLEDMLYHTSFVLQQKEINPTEIQLHWHGDSNNAQGEEFAAMFGKIMQENASPISFHVKRTHQLHCV